jgi:hypothetical protein
MYVLLICSVLLLGHITRAVDVNPPESLREMIRARQCLHHKVTNFTDNWLKHLRGDLNYRRRLESIITKQMGARLASGEPLCMAVRSALQRVTNHHRYVMDQRAAQGLVVLYGDGWAETLRLMESAWKPVLVQCQQLTMGLSADKLNSRALATCIEEVQHRAHVAMVTAVFGS